VVICGAASQYDTGTMYEPYGVRGPSNYIKLAEKSASMSGFTVMDYTTPMNLARFTRYMLWHYHRGNIQAIEHFEDGIESFAGGLEDLFNNGKHVGRLLVDVDGTQNGND